MIRDFDPLKNEMYKVLDNNGKVVAENWTCPFNDEELKDIYNKMLFARTADLMAVSFQRQGRMYTYPPSLGQEAVAVASGLTIQHDDWLVPAFRELGAYIAKGATLKELYMYYRGDEWGVYFEKANRIVPLSVPIASQLLHAAGIGIAMKHKQEKSTVFTYVGDGGTSEGDFYEALNFAGVWKAPVVFVIQNNQFAISVPVARQTAAMNLAVKGIAAGVPSIKVDGNDIFAMYDVLQEARRHVMEGNGPFLIEAVTFRKGAHTTSDDPTRYRTKDEEAEWEKTDPLERLKKYLIDKGLHSEEEENKLLEEYKKKINIEFDEAERTEYNFDDVFEYQYVDMPDELKKQKQKHKQFMQWKEAQK